MTGEQIMKVTGILLENLIPTLKIFGFTLLFSIPLGLVVAALKMCRFKPISWLTNLYILIMRGTPLMLQIIVVYYALPFLKTATKGSGGFMENLLSGVDPAAEGFMFTMVIIAFVLNYAAYFAEIFRGGIESIPRGQYEAAAALGMTKAQTFFRIILPQVIKRIVPASSNEVITLVKDTSLANVVAYSEIMLAAKQQMMNYSSLVPLFIAGVFYFVMATVLTALFGFIEKKLNYFRYGAVNMSILSVKNISKSFGKLDVLNDISFNVEQGEVISIIGPSGSGKSTLLRCINQFEKIDSGECEICGITMTKNDENGKAVYADNKTLHDIRLKIGLVFQNFNLFPHMSVLKNITEAPVHVLKQDKAQAEQTAMELLGKMGLADKANEYPCNLSGGQQQRVSIARALALSPELLFFDEPTSALDPELTGEILKVIKSLAEEKMTMVIVTHEMQFASEISDRVIFMDGGYVIENGTPDEVFNNSQNERTRQFLERYHS